MACKLSLIFVHPAKISLLMKKELQRGMFRWLVHFFLFFAHPVSFFLFFFIHRVRDVTVDDFAGTVKEFISTNGKPGSQERAPAEYKFYKSLQQTMLSRELSEYATRSSEARRLLLYMATSKAPDELYFPTLTQLDKTYADK